MAYADPSLPLQKAIKQLLADQVAMVNGQIYDAIGPHEVMPYLSFGPFQLLPEHGDCLDGGEAIIQIDGWAAGPDSRQIKQLGAAVASALDRAELTLDAPQAAVELSVEQIQYLREPDGITAHAVITVHALTEPSGG